MKIGVRWNIEIESRAKISSYTIDIFVLSLYIFTVFFQCIERILS